MGLNLIDLRGSTFGQWTVLDEPHVRKGRITHWKCRCSCGAVKLVSTRMLRNNKSRKCAACAQEVASKKRIDERGNTHGRWTVLQQTARTRKNRSVEWLCRCVCGAERWLSGNTLRQGNSRGCSSCSQRLPGTTAAFNRLYRSYVANAKKRSIEFSLSEDEFKRLTSSDCRYCGVPPSRIVKSAGALKFYVSNGIDRINNDEGYTASNVCTCCGICNHAKATMTQTQFIEWLLKAAEHLQTALPGRGGAANA